MRENTYLILFVSELSDGNSSGTGVKKGTDNVMASKIGQSSKCLQIIIYNF